MSVFPIGHDMFMSQMFCLFIYLINHLCFILSYAIFQSKSSLMESQSADAEPPPPPPPKPELRYPGLSRGPAGHSEG